MESPNILCISIDSLRSDFASFISNSDAGTTPFLNSLSPQSTIFENTITPSTWTLPVHTSIFTGLFPPEHGVQTGEETLGDHPTFAEILSKQGYETKAFYKNGWLATGEILRGFEQKSDTVDTDPKSKTQEKSRKKRISEGIGKISPKFEEILENSWDAMRQFQNWQFTGTHRSRLDKGGRQTIDQALAEVDSINEPFCWFVHLNDAHWKYAPPSPHHTAFSERSDLGLLYNYSIWQSRVYGNRTNRLKNAIGDISPPKREIETFKNLYRGGIRYCDTLIQELINYMKSVGIWENTILIVFGDHGDGFGEDRVFGHHFSVHDSIIKVPLLIRDPTDRLKSEQISSPTSLVDIYPTILGFVEEPSPSPNAVDLAEERRDFAYTYYNISDHDYYTGAPERGIELDRLPPAQQYVIYGGAKEKGIKYPESDEFVEFGDLGDNLENRLNTHIESLIQVQTKDGSIGVNVEQQLEKLGYLKE